MVPGGWWLIQSFKRLCCYWKQISISCVKYAGISYLACDVQIFLLCISAIRASHSKVSVLWCSKTIRAWLRAICMTYEAYHHFAWNWTFKGVLLFVEKMPKDIFTDSVQVSLSYLRVYHRIAIENTIYFYLWFLTVLFRNLFIKLK